MLPVFRWYHINIIFTCSIHSAHSKINTLSLSPVIRLWCDSKLMSISAISQDHISNKCSHWHQMACFEPNWVKVIFRKLILIGIIFLVHFAASWLWQLWLFAVYKLMLGDAYACVLMSCISIVSGNGLPLVLLATSHHLYQWWPKSLTPYAATRLQRVNIQYSAVVLSFPIVIWEDGCLIS